MTEDDFTPEQVQLLLGLGVREDQLSALRGGTAIAYPFRTEREPAVAVLQLRTPRLRSGIVEIRDPGGGHKSFLRFRSSSFALARALGLSEVELFGAEVINRALEGLLQRKGFERKEDQCPDELGGGPMTILARVFPVPGQAGG